MSKEETFNEKRQKYLKEKFKEERIEEGRKLWEERNQPDTHLKHYALQKEALRGLTDPLSPEKRLALIVKQLEENNKVLKRILDSMV